MGFYIDLRPVAANHFKETEIPFAFWALYSIAGFALLCMGLASYSLFGDLIKMGDPLDYVLLGLILSSIQFYLLVGIKLFFIKKFVSVRNNEIVYGFTFNQKKFYEKHLKISDIEKVSLINQRPTKNVAPVMHNNVEYHIQGHWRIVADLKNGKSVVLDKHTDVDALKPLYECLVRLTSP